MSEHDIETIEVSIESAEKAIKKMRSFQQLQNNSDFKKIIEEGYFVEAASNITRLLAVPGMEQQDQQNALYKRLSAISELRQYFIMINALGKQAQKSLVDHQEALEEVGQE